MVSEGGMGGVDVLNPYKIWLLIVFVSGISFFGYILVKLIYIHPISQVNALEVRSHPWQEMLKKQPAAPQSPILSLVPEDRSASASSETWGADKLGSIR